MSWWVMAFFLIAGGALSSSFIPVFTEYVSTGRNEEAWKIFSTVASVMTVVVLCFVVAGEVFTVRHVFGFGRDAPDGVIALDDLYAAADIDPVASIEHARAFPPGPAASSRTWRRSSPPPSPSRGTAAP